MSGKILITGAFGNLGNWMTHYFCKQNYDVYALTKQIPSYTFPDIDYTVLEADISDPLSLEEAIGNRVFDYCIHLASYNEYFHEGYPRKALLVNALGTRNLLEILKGKVLKRFIYFSTVHVYGAQKGNITEKSELCPANDYASTHLFAEYYVRQLGNNYGIGHTIFRLSNSYGCPKSVHTSKWYLVLNDMARSAYLHRKIYLKTNGMASRDFIWMGDVCNLFAEIDTMKSGEIYNLSSGHNRKIIEIAHLVQNVFRQKYGKEIEVHVNTDDTNEYPPVHIDNSKLLRDFKITFHDAFEREIHNIFDLLERSDGQ